MSWHQHGKAQCCVADALVHEGEVIKIFAVVPYAAGSSFKVRIPMCKFHFDFFREDAEKQGDNKNEDENDGSHTDVDGADVGNGS